jgi:TolB-like protein
MSFFAELRRRNVVRVAGAYAVVGWVLVQVATTLEESIGLPGWFDGLIVAVLLIGLPVALILAWVFEVTPEGVVRTGDIREDEQVTRSSGRNLDYAIVAGLVVLGGIIVWQGSDAPDNEVEVVEAQNDAAENAAVFKPYEKSIAVLPFANRSPNPDDAFFADGVHDDLLTHLSKIADMRVISRTSVMGYVGSERKIPDIARELGVATVMEGAVQRAGNRVRINVQLIDADTDAHLWAEIYDRELTADNIFDIQSEITKAIAIALDAALSSTAVVELEKRPTRNLAAYDAYITGRLRAGRYFESEERFRQAIAAFDEAIVLDPEFAEAYAGKAYMQVATYWYTGIEGAWLENAWASLQRARTLAPDAIETLTALGYYYYWGLLDYERADISFASALEKSPNNVDALAGKAYSARRDGRFDEATDLLERAHRLDPLNFDAILNLAETNVKLGRFDEAESAMRRARAMAPVDSLDAVSAADVWARMGDITQAWAATAYPAQSTSVMFAFRVQYALATRDPANIRLAIESWPEDLRRPGNFTEAYALAKARVLMFLGDSDAASKLLAEIRTRVDSAEVPYPQGWKANAIYWPVELPGLLGDLEGVRASVAEYESAARRDVWSEPDIYFAFARAFVNSGDIENAFAYVDRMVALRGPWVFLQLSGDVTFDPLGEHPRYRALQSDFEAWVASTGR